MRYLIVLLLAACATDEDRRVRQEEYINSLAARCSAYGMPPRSPQMQQCMMQLDLNRANNDAAMNMLMLQQGAAGLNQPAMVVPAPVPSAPTNMNCRRTAAGNMDCMMR